MAETFTFEVPDTPPKEIKERPVKDSPKVGRPRGYSLKLKSQLAETYASVGLLVYFKDQVCGGAIVEGADACAESLTRLAADNPRVKRALEMLMSGSAWTAVISAHMAVALPILKHHNLLPEGMMRGLMGNPLAMPNQPQDEVPENDLPHDPEPVENPPKQRRARSKAKVGNVEGDSPNGVAEGVDVAPGNPLV